MWNKWVQPSGCSGACRHRELGNRGSGSRDPDPSSFRRPLTLRGLKPLPSTVASISLTTPERQRCPTILTASPEPLLFKTRWQCLGHRQLWVLQRCPPSWCPHPQQRCQQWHRQQGRQWPQRHRHREGAWQRWWRTDSAGSQIQTEEYLCSSATYWRRKERSLPAPVEAWETNFKKKKKSFTQIRKLLTTTNVPAVETHQARWWKCGNMVSFSLSHTHTAKTIPQEPNFELWKFAIW